MDLDYHKIQRLSNSGLTQFWRKQNGLPELAAKQSTLDFGSLMHTGIYEPDKYDHDLVRSWVPSDRAKLSRMIQAGRSCPLIRSLVQNPSAEIEKPIFFDLFGVPFKAKPDLVIPFKIVHDAKSTATGSLDEFVSVFDEYGYFRSAWIYLLATGAKRMYFSGISKKSGHPVFTVDTKKFWREIRVAGKQVKELVQAWKDENSI